MTNLSKANASFDLADLLEYDEFDGYDGSAATESDNCMTINDNDYGVPLSVELSESMCQNNINRAELMQLQRANAIDTIDPAHAATTETTVTSSSSVDEANEQEQNFVKSAEIFLRIDNNEESSTTTTITMASSSFNSNKQSMDSTNDTGDPGEPGEPSSGQFSSSIDGGDVIELQYENEFFDPDDEESNFGESSTAQRHHLGGNVEYDNEQLLLEGIFLLSFVPIHITRIRNVVKQNKTKQ